MVRMPPPLLFSCLTLFFAVSIRVPIFSTFHVFVTATYGPSILSSPHIYIKGGHLHGFYAAFCPQPVWWLPPGHLPWSPAARPLCGFPDQELILRSIWIRIVSRAFFARSRERFLRSIVKQIRSPLTALPLILHFHTLTLQNATRFSIKIHNHA